MSINQVEWHPNDENILATASMDQTVKIWNIKHIKKPICSIKNTEVGKIRWLFGGENNTHSVGIGARSMDKSMTVWNLDEPYCPIYAFKNMNKSCISDFAFSQDKKHAYLISKDYYVIVQSLDRATRVIDERRGNSLACDLTDGYVFGWDTKPISSKSENISLSEIDKKKVKPSKRLNFINVTNFKSCYEETHNPFKSLDEEYLLFITEYKTEGDNIIENLKSNVEISKKFGKCEISAIWESLLNLVKNGRDEGEMTPENSKKSVNSRDIRRKVSINSRIERAQLIVKFYKNNQEQFEYDIQSRKIKIQTGEISIHEDYELDLLAKVDHYNEKIKTKNSVQNLTSNHKSEIISKVLHDLIDNGEFIHAYKMYLTLSKHVKISKEKQKLWEFTYIDILGTMGFYTRAAETIKHSKVSNIKEMNKNDTILRIKCIKCGKTIPKNNEGYCEKCKKFSVYCSVCSRPCKGLTFWCQICSHGGHMKEIVEWFTAKEDGEGRTCPTGCGCKCFKF